MSMTWLKSITIAACVAAGVIGGVMITLVGAGRRRYVLAAPGNGSDPELDALRDDLALPAADQPFRELRGALLGKHRKQIARVLGTPATASLTFGSAAASTNKAAKPMTFWQATTWYYPFDQKHKKAIAIRFVRDRAKDVEFIGSPA